MILDLSTLRTFDEFKRDLVMARAVTEAARRKRASTSLLHYITYMDPSYTPQRFHIALTGIMDQFIEDVENERAPRYIVLAPPRHGKSITTTINGSAYTMGRHPDWWVMNLAYGKELATTFGRQVRAQMSCPEHLNIFPHSAPRKDSNSVDFIWLEQGGGYIAEGAGGIITGRGAHCMFIDDPLKGREQADSETERRKQLAWYMSTARSRLSPGGGIMLTMTPWHEEDLAHELIRIARERPDADQWKVFRFPAMAEERDPLGREPGEALDPDRYPVEELRKIRANDAREWNALYQCRPTSEAGDFFALPLIESATIPAHCAPPQETMVNYISVDPAVTKESYSDPSVIWPFGVDADDVVHFKPNVIRRKTTPGELIELIVSSVIENNAHGVIIESGTIYHSIIETLKKRMRERKTAFRILHPTHSKDKVTRAHPLHARMEHGMAKFIDGPHLREWVWPEFLSFPHGSHDDGVDACSQAIEMLNEIRKFVPRGAIQVGPDPIDRFSREGIRLATQARRRMSRSHADHGLDMFKIR